MASLPGIPAQYNKKSSAVKRIMQEARELVREPSTDFAANPLDTDIFEWHFTIRGPEGTDFEGGLYHGRILLPNNYPFAPPSLMFLTPNGRFELHKKVCLSITGYHPEYWQPAWGIRTVLVAVMGFLPTQSKGAIGGMDTSVEARKVLAIKSKTWLCPTCRSENIETLPDVAPEDVVKPSLKADEMPPEFSFGYEADKKKQDAAAAMEVEGGENKVTGIDKDASSSTAAPGAGSGSTPTTSSTLSDRLTTIADVGATSQNISSPPSAPQTTLSPCPAATAVSSSPQDPPRAPNVDAATSYSTSELRARAVASSQSIPQPQAQQQQHSVQVRAQTGRAGSGIPVWLDALILGLAGILAVLIIRRFF